VYKAWLRISLVVYVKLSAQRIETETKLSKLFQNCFVSVSLRCADGFRFDQDSVYTDITDVDWFDWFQNLVGSSTSLSFSLLLSPVTLSYLPLQPNYVVWECYQQFPQVHVGVRGRARRQRILCSLIPGNCDRMLTVANVLRRTIKVNITNCLTSPKLCEFVQEK